MFHNYTVIHKVQACVELHLIKIENIEFTKCRTLKAEQVILNISNLSWIYTICAEAYFTSGLKTCDVCQTSLKRGSMGYHRMHFLLDLFWNLQKLPKHTQCMQRGIMPWAISLRHDLKIFTTDKTDKLCLKSLRVIQRVSGACHHHCNIYISIEGNQIL